MLLRGDRCTRRRPWWTRRGLAAAGALAILVVAGRPVPAAAAPSDQPGGTSGVLESEALDRLQRRAAEVQDGLQARQDAIAEARAELARAEDAVAVAQALLADAEDELATHRSEVARYARAIYRNGGIVTPLTLLLTGSDPGEVIATMGFLDVVDAHVADVIGAAEELRRSATDQQQRAQNAVDTAQARADQVAARVAELEAAASAATTELDEALGAVDRQLAALQQEQLRVNDQTAASWQAYLAQLRAAGIVPPPARQLLEPTVGLPAGLVPVGAVEGGAQQGAAQLPAQPSSLLVMPEETLVAVSAAMEALSLPYAPGTAGPESWDCGSLVQSSYARAGIALPATQDGLFSVTRPVPAADLLPGDLVFLGTPESGLGHVGIALDAQTMLAADARAGAVVVRTLPADQVLGLGRPSTGLRAAVEAPGPAEGALRVECGNTIHPPSYDGLRSWGGYPNGLIPPSALCPLGAGAHALRCDAAAAYRAMSAAFAAAFGGPICITDSYRTYAGQVDLYGRKPALAAVPGTSNHGWGLAVDLCGGIERFGTPQYAWLTANAGRFGFLHPTWADQGRGREEPWHWEFSGT